MLKKEMTKSKNNKGEESLVKKNKNKKTPHNFISVCLFFRILPVIFSDSPFARVHSFYWWPMNNTKQEVSNF